MNRLSELLAEKKKSSTPAVIKGDDAARLIASSPFEPHDVVGFDQVEAKRLGVSVGSTVKVAPVDTGESSKSLSSPRLIGLREKLSNLWKTGGAEPGRGCH